LRRALTAETGEITLSADNGWWWRVCHGESTAWDIWSGLCDPVSMLAESSRGVYFLMRIIARVSLDVKKDGELTEETLQRVAKEFHDIPNGISKKLKGFRAMLLDNPEGLDADQLKAKHRQAVEEYLGNKFQGSVELYLGCQQLEKKREAACQAASVLPSADIMDKILRYETTLKRQLYCAMGHLERLQRMRKGETVPPPLTMEVSHKC
jgi:hypothetical protein